MQSTYHVVALDAVLDVRRPDRRLLVKLVAGDEVDRQRYRHFLRLRLVHQLLDNLGALFVKQRLANLSTNCNNDVIGTSFVSI